MTNFFKGNYRYFVRKTLYFILQLYYQVEYCFLKLIPSKKENSILIMRLDAIGDSIIWLDSAKEFRKHFPDKHLVLLCNVAWEEIAKNLPYFDEVISIDKNKFLRKISYRLKTLKNLKKRKFEQIINPAYSRDFFVQDILIHNLRAEKKIGYQGNYHNTANTLSGFGIDNEKYTNRLERKANKWYSVLLEADREQLMELSRNADFIRKLFQSNFQSQLPEFPFQIPVYNNLLKERYVVLFIGASTPRKYWRKENYEQLISQLSISTIVLCGGKPEESIGEEIMKKMSDSGKNICNLIGKTSLMDLFSIIQNAEYIITNDTSASHITVAVRTPSVCLLGGTHFGRFQPYVVEYLEKEDKKYIPKVVYNKMDCFNCNNQCRFIKDKNTIWPCIESITVEQVLEKVKEIERES